MKEMDEAELLVWKLAVFLRIERRVTRLEEQFSWVDGSERQAQTEASDDLAAALRGYALYVARLSSIVPQEAP